MGNGYKSSISGFLCFSFSNQEATCRGIKVRLKNSLCLLTINSFANGFHAQHPSSPVILRMPGSIISLKRGNLGLREVKGISCLREPGSGGAWASDFMSIPVLRTSQDCLLVLALELCMAHRE